MRTEDDRENASRDGQRFYEVLIYCETYLHSAEKCGIYLEHTTLLASTDATDLQLISPTYRRFPRTN